MTVSEWPILLRTNEVGHIIIDQEVISNDRFESVHLTQQQITDVVAYARKLELLEREQREAEANRKG